MGRAPCCEKARMKKGPWTPEEDQTLISFILQHGHSNWRALPKLAGLLRCGKSCRLRWMNYLRPDIKRGNFTKEEEDKIIHLHELLGNRWSVIAGKLPGRTDNEIKNVWHTHLKKKLKDYKPPKSRSKSKLESCSTRNDSTCDNSLSPSSSISDISSVTLIGGESETHKSLMEVKSKDITSNIEGYDLFESFEVELDEGFWKETLYEDEYNNNSGVLTMEDSTSALEVINGLCDDQLQTYENEFHHFVGNHHNMDEEMGFWYDLLAKTGSDLIFN